MENIITAIEILAFITGLGYIVLEIMQKNAMWLIGILTGAACAFSFGVQHLYASMSLNIYYVLVSFWGLYQWRKDSTAMTSSHSTPKVATVIKDNAETPLHLSHISPRTLIISGVAMLIGTMLLILLLRVLGGEETAFDAAVTVLSAIATYWLGKSYPEQWLLWILADALSMGLCLITGMYWMTVLYLAYTAAAFYGYRYWLRNGKYI